MSESHSPLGDFRTNRRVLLLIALALPIGALSAVVAKALLEKCPDKNLTVLEAGSPEPIVAFPEETLHDAIARMLKHDVGRLPVVDRHDARKIVGYLGRASILSSRQHYYDEEEIRERGFGLDGVAVEVTVA